MVMTEACQDVADVHDSMPVILRRDGSAADPQGHRTDWLGSEADAKDHRAPDKAELLCRPYPEQMVCERTGESWVRR